MNWAKLDINALPKGEVLAANFNAGSRFLGEKLVGKLKWEEDVKCVCCRSDTSILVNPSHYILINSIGFEIG